MGRRSNFKRRELTPDLIFNDCRVTKLINMLMYDGKKSVAAKVVYNVFDILDKQSVLEKKSAETENKMEESDIKNNGINIFFKALDNVSPSIEIKSKRIGGSTFQTIVDISDSRKSYFGIKWLISSARNRKDKNGMAEKLAVEIIDASKKLGGAIKKMEDLARQAESSKVTSFHKY